MLEHVFLSQVRWDDENNYWLLMIVEKRSSDRNIYRYICFFLSLRTACAFLLLHHLDDKNNYLPSEKKRLRTFVHSTHNKNLP